MDSPSLNIFKLKEDVFLEDLILVRGNISSSVQETWMYFKHFRYSKIEVKGSYCPFRPFSSPIQLLQDSVVCRGTTDRTKRAEV